MSDNLRGIAAVLAQHHHWDYAGDLTCACGESFGKETGWEAAVQEWAQHVADAVIAELGLREQTGNNAAAPSVIPCAEYLRTHHRYVTDWKADEPPNSPVCHCGETVADWGVCGRHLEEGLADDE